MMLSILRDNLIGNKEKKLTQIQMLARYSRFVLDTIFMCGGTFKRFDNQRRRQKSQHNHNQSE